MPGRARCFALGAALLALTGCTMQPFAPPASTYFWIPTPSRPDATNARIRTQLDLVLEQKGYHRAANGRWAIAISVDNPRSGDGSLGLGMYTGGYPYFAPTPAPHGFVQVNAYDMRSAELQWRISIAHANATAVGDAALARALADAMKTLPNAAPSRRTMALGSARTNAGILLAPAGAPLARTP